MLVAFVAPPTISIRVSSLPDSEELSVLVVLLLSLLELEEEEEDELLSSRLLLLEDELLLELLLLLELELKRRDPGDGSLSSTLVVFEAPMLVVFVVP